MKKITRSILIISGILSLIFIAAKVTEYPEDTSPTGDDIMYMVNDPGGTPVSRKVTLQNIANLVGSSNAIFNSSRWLESDEAITAIAQGNWRNSTSGPSFYLYSGRGTKASPGYRLSGDIIGEIKVSAYHGDAFYNSRGVIRFIAAGDHSDSEQPTRITFVTTNFGSESATTKFVIGAQGNIGQGIGNANPDENIRFQIINDSSTKVGQEIKLASSATADAFQITSNSGNDGDLFQIESDGKVGIGTATPTAKLNITSTTVDDPVITLSSIATNDDPTITTYQGRVTTTNADVTLLKSIPVTSDRTYFIHVEVIARCTGGGSGTIDDSASYIRNNVFATKLGVLGRVGVEQEAFTVEDQPGWNITVEAAGSDAIEVSAIGELGTDIVWHLVKCEVSYVGT